MAQIGRRASRARPQYAQRVYYSRLLSGRVVASKWPRAQAGRTAQKLATTRQVFKGRVYFVKRMHPRETEPLRKALAEFLNANRGLRGSAAIRLRDLLMQILSGRMFSYGDDQRSRIYHDVVHREITTYLDWLEPQHGSLIARTSETWLPTWYAMTGMLLKLHDTTPDTGCQPSPQVPPYWKIPRTP